MSASWTDGQRRSVQVRRSAPTQSRPQCCRLHGPALRLPAQAVGGNNTKPCHLRNGEVDEHDTALEDLHAERNVGCEHQDARREGRQQDRQIEGVRVHRFASSISSIMSSYQLNRSLEALSPPTVNGSTTTGMCARSANHSEARGSL